MPVPASQQDTFIYWLVPSLVHIKDRQFFLKISFFHSIYKILYSTTNRMMNLMLLRKTMDRNN